MPNFEKLSEHARKLHMLLQDQQPGLATWNLFVGETWKVIADMWDPDSLVKRWMEVRIANLETQLKRNRQGLMNILEFRKLDAVTWGQRDGYGGRYGALTQEEIEWAIADIDRALGTANARGGAQAETRDAKNFGAQEHPAGGTKKVPSEMELLWIQPAWLCRECHFANLALRIKCRNCGIGKNPGTSGGTKA
jgi:hypothetical protein